MGIDTYGFVIDPEGHPRHDDNHEARNVDGEDEERELAGEGQRHSEATIGSYIIKHIEYYATKSQILELDFCFTQSRHLTTKAKKFFPFPTFFPSRRKCDCRQQKFERREKLRKLRPFGCAVHSAYMKSTYMKSWVIRNSL